MTAVPEDPDTLFRCTDCDWVGPAEDVEWGDWTPLPDYALTDMEPSRCDCPECGAEVEPSPIASFEEVADGDR